MPLVLRAAVEDDIPRILQVMDAAFAQDPWHLIMKPSQPPPHAKVKAFERFRNELVDDPVVTFMVVEDTDINETVAFARWNFYREERPKSEWEKEPQIEWDEGRQEAWCSPLRFHKLHDLPTELLKYGDPRYQQRCGKCFSQWHF